MRLSTRSRNTRPLSHVDVVGNYVLINFLTFLDPQGARTAVCTFPLPNDNTLSRYLIFSIPRCVTVVCSIQMSTSGFSFESSPKPWTIPQEFQCTTTKAGYELLICKSSPPTITQTSKFNFTSVKRAAATIQYNNKESKSRRRMQRHLRTTSRWQAKQKKKKEGTTWLTIKYQNRKVSKVILHNQLHYLTRNGGV